MVLTRLQSIKIQKFRHATKAFIVESSETPAKLNKSMLDTIKNHFQCYKEEVENINQVDESEEYIIEEMIEIQLKINELKVNHQSSNVCESSPICNSVNESENNHIKLPRLKIEKFTGDPERWPCFWGLFEKYIHMNMSLNNYEKFSYLIGYLDVKTKDTISGIPLDENNYQAALDTLTERFGDKQELIKSHYIKLAKIPKATNKGIFMKIYPQIEKELKYLMSLRENIEQPSLLINIREKFQILS